jgi:hypothetical protein
MYRAYLSYLQLKHYLALLEEQKLVYFDQESGLYQITARAIEYMEAYDKITELMPINSVRRERDQSDFFNRPDHARTSSPGVVQSVL